MRAARTPVGLEMPVTLSPIAASAAASDPLAVAVARFPAAFEPLVTVEVVTFCVVVCSSARLHSNIRICYSCKCSSCRTSYIRSAADSEFILLSPEACMTTVWLWVLKRC